MADIERLNRALAWIEEHPEQHDQRVWARDAADGGRVDCGTAMCLAGWVVAQNQPDAVFVRSVWDVTHQPNEMLSAVRTDDGVEVISDLARKLLDVNAGQADALFSASNTLDDLKRMRDQLAENPDVPGFELADDYDDYDLADYE